MIYYPQCIAVLQVLLEDTDEDTPEIIVAPPRRCTVHLNDYRHADTWELELSSRVLPLDPDIVRSVGVEIYLFDAGRVTADVEPFLSALDPVTGRPLYLEITGVADRESLHMEEGGAFTLRGQDYTTLVAGREWLPVGKVIPVGQPIDHTVQALVDEALFAAEHGGSTLNVTFIPDEKMPAPPIVGQGLSRAFKRGIPVPKGYNYWDAIYLLALRHGCIAYVHGNDLVISAPACLTDDNAANVRRVAYGRSLKFLSCERDIGRKPAPQILATSYDPKQRRVLEALWPTHAPVAKKKTAKKLPGQPRELKPRAFAGANKRKWLTATGHTKDEVRRVEAPPGITDPAVLENFARAYQAQLSRGESQLKFGTSRLTDLDGKSLLNLRVGNAVQVEWDAFRADEMRQLSPDARVARLRALGYAGDVAVLIARNFENLHHFGRPYYCSGVSKEWSVDEDGGGLTIEVEAVNFVDPEYHES